MRLTNAASKAVFTMLQRSLPRRAGCGEHATLHAKTKGTASTKPAPKGRMRLACSVEDALAIVAST